YLKNGREIQVKHLGFDYWGYMFINFFTPMRCYLCPDKMSALADISIGDNWTNHLEHENGSSVMVIRNKTFVKIINDMTKQSLIKSHEINDANQLIWVQDIKQKTNIMPRKYWWEKFGGKSPHYGKVTLSKPPRY